jgi:type II secretory pathway pseudopilin PulG
MNQNNHSESGFTLVELLVVMGTIFVLVQISLANYNLYKEKLYLAHADDVMRQLKTAVESGKIDIGVAENDQDWDTWVWVSQTKSAPPIGFGFQELLSGYSHDKHMQIFVDHNGVCDAGYWGDWCQVTAIQVRHCNTDVTKAWWINKDGSTGTWEWDVGGAPCM